MSMEIIRCLTSTLAWIKPKRFVGSVVDLRPSGSAVHGALSVAPELLGLFALRELIWRL